AAGELGGLLAKLVYAVRGDAVGLLQVGDEAGHGVAAGVLLALFRGLVGGGVLPVMAGQAGELDVQQLRASTLPGGGYGFVDSRVHGGYVAALDRLDGEVVEVAQVIGYGGRGGLVAPGH